jgi:hypothetical protein
MGISATTKIVTQSFYTGRRGVLQSGNRECVTVVESIGASGQALPPYIIFKEKNFMCDDLMTFQNTGLLIIVQTDGQVMK